MIRIQNIYYMLSYAFQILNEQGYKKVATEKFENAAELYASILINGIKIQIKRGLIREYIPQCDALSTIRGKVSVSESIKQQSILKKQLVCQYEEFSSNAYMNRIIRTSLEILLQGKISSQYKKSIRKLLVYFSGISPLDIYNINWRLHFNRNNQQYRMLVFVCYLVLKGLLQTTSAGKVELMDFLDEQRMCRLYEKFILAYYQKEHPEIKASAPSINWNLDDGYDEMLPIMRSDIVLSKGDKSLIIDAKYYEHTTQLQYEHHKLHSSNLYQIFTYVKNFDANHTGNTSGMLLYAKTDDELSLDHEYRMSGNRIAAKTLDLNQDFNHIREQLDGIVTKEFGAI